MLMFADNLLLFSHGNPASVGILKSYLERFSGLSNLKANALKGSCFVSCRDESLKENILTVAGFQRGMLPMRHLRMPLLSTKLSYGDCRPIIDKVKNKICS